MKLSESIWEGSKYPDIHGPVFGKDGSCCAVGGILRNLGYNSTSEVNINNVYSTFPLMTLSMECPLGCVTHYYAKTVHGIIAHFFEDHNMNKKAIAMWVESIEKQLETEQTVAQESQDVYDDIFENAGVENV